MAIVKEEDEKKAIKAAQKLKDEEENKKLEDEE